MAKHTHQLHRDDELSFNLFSAGRRSTAHSFHLSGAQIEQIQRTVRGVPEVMVKVTGGGRSVGAVAAHLSYVSHRGEFDLETEDGQEVSKDGQKALLKDWHLELVAGQYRRAQCHNTSARTVKLVHNIVLSMPAPTPSEKVLAAAKTFAREKFGLQYRYAMALHTHQRHPHVHLIVKAEDEHGCRLHIDKALLRDWRHEFAQMMRAQGVAANATRRAVRGQSKRGSRDAQYRVQRRGSSYTLRRRVEGVVRELSRTGTIRDPARVKLEETRKAVLNGWMGIADRLDAQGEIVLAGDVRYFARHLPLVLTDRERLAQEFVRHLAQSVSKPGGDPSREREVERIR